MDWEDVRVSGSKTGKGTGKAGNPNAGGSRRRSGSAHNAGTNGTARKQPAKKRNNKKIRRIMVFLLIVSVMVSIIVVSFTISYEYVMKSEREASMKPEIVIDESEGVEFVIERGASTSQIAKKLAEQGLIKNETVFKLLSKINGYDGTYKSGTHIVSPDLSYDEMMRVLSSAPVTRKVTIPEGKTFLQIVDILYNSKIIKDKQKFIECANTEEFDYDFLKGLPQREYRLEGYLFPDTYEYDYNASDREIITKMLDNFDRKFKQQYRDMIASLPVEMTMDDVVILASIIEREAKDPDDRHIIAGVLYNRLKNKDASLRKLQVDATIQYIYFRRTGAYKERLLYEDYEIEDEYNTYLHEGLPPGPICCPGEASIRAAVNPDDTPYLYYVAKGDGSHAFARTYREHQENVKKYIRNN
ncbi:MAG TPA: endolytic transglycosylase MltG [Clostridiales bacterium]|nr:endolytic transglycosylase MltG [Clostridiales bacterium]HPV00954.1 endolytic transglycosylase MltG [Clostridiales bacterium]